MKNMKLKKSFVLILFFVSIFCFVGCSSNPTSSSPSLKSGTVTISKSNAASYVKNLEIIDINNVGNNVTFKFKLTLNSQIKSISNVKITYSGFLKINYVASNGSKLQKQWGYVSFTFNFKNSLECITTKTVYNNANHTISRIEDASIGNKYISSASGTISIN